MELIHAYGGNPDAMFYSSHFLPAGWLPSNPTWSAQTAETYQGTIDLTPGDDGLQQHRLRSLVADLGTAKMDQIAHAKGCSHP